jgi:hypothetical protein
MAAGQHAEERTEVEEAVVERVSERSDVNSCETVEEGADTKTDT